MIINKLRETISDIEPHDQSRLVPVRPVYVAYRGSHAHGTYTPPSDPQAIDDVDILVCYIPELSRYFGLHDGSPGHGKQVQIGKWDAAIYEIRHYAYLLANANPDVLQSLWVKPEHRILVTPEGEELIKNRHLFTSKMAAKSFGGYAKGQMHRMTAFHDEGEGSCCAGVTHHTAPCTGAGAGLKKFVTGYMGAKRKALVQKYGYDTKNAAHLIRLIRMAKEFLKTGELQVDRSDLDADELRRIKAGEFNLETIKAQAEKEFAQLSQAELESTLPDRPDRVAIDKLLTEILCVAHDTVVVYTSAYVKGGRFKDPNFKAKNWE